MYLLKLRLHRISVDSIETYAYGTSKYLVCKKARCNNIIKQCKKLLHKKRKHNVTKGNIKEHNLNWPQIPDLLHGILIIRSCGSEKTDSLFNLISHQPDIDKTYLYVKDPFGAKYQLLIIK